MGNIVLLDDLTINKIAAGEVIERPASVVKEMVENSIDAGATNITVEIKNGGISFIKVTDNGKGIAPDDLEIAFERHATSKIRSADDLNTVMSMGFRGEALASIAAIARVEMMSKTANQQNGYKIIVEGGKFLDMSETGCSTGTSITVTNLFYNTPVRYKFLRKDFTEAGYIEDAISRIALIHPEIAIKLINSGRTVIQTNGNGDLRSVIYSIYGKDVAEAVLEADYTYEDIHIKGVVGKPEISRSNRAYQLFYVNKRFIKDKSLSAAAEKAYKGLIPAGKFSFLVLNIEMDPHKVDVNVHPAKLEVRFEEENKVFQAVYHAIKDSLLKTELVANSEKQIHSDNEPPRNSARERTFEERLRDLKRTKLENQSGGLFSFRKQNESKIEEYTDQESKIKTNSIIEQDKPLNQDKSASKVGEPINTADILLKLKEMKQNLENEIKEKGLDVSNVNESEESYNIKGEDLKEEQDIENADKITDDEQKVDNNQEINVNIESENINSDETKISDKEDNNTNEIDTKKEENINDELAQKREEKNKEIAQKIEKLENPEIKQEFQEIKEKMVQLNDNPEVVSDNFNEMYAKLFGRMPIGEDEEPKVQKSEEDAIDIVKDNISMFENIEEFKKPTYKFIGIVFKTYIIIEMNKEMYIIDQHAAHERIMYEKVKNNYYSDQSKDSQLLLLPDVITLTHKEMDIAKENMQMFEKAGFSLEEFGENTIKLTGVPTVCVDLDTKELFLETLDEINTVARTAKQEKEEKFIATVACKAAVKANMALDEQEVDSLMDKLLELPNPFTCPHGRPTAIKMSQYDIERKFARK